jgi:hypothetical protein
VAKVSSHSAKNTFRWHYWASVIQNLRLDELQEQAHRLLAAQRGMGSTGWLVVTLGGFALLYWNGRLFVATGTGVAVMLLVYVLHGWQPSLDWSQLRQSANQFLRGWNQPFVVSAGAGAIATVAAYLAVTLYTEASSGWVASAAVLQGLGTLAVLVLLVGQRAQRQTNLDRHHADRVLQDLTHRDPLKRLIAVRQLTDRIALLDDLQNGSSTTEKQFSRRAIADYLQVMVSQEKHSVVRDAILDGLQTVDIVHQLQAATQPLVNLATRPKVPIQVHPPKQPLQPAPLRKVR